jgi:phospholipid N-methyltransferase
VHTLKFLKGFLSAPSQVASILPSSRQLADAVAHAGLSQGEEKPRVVVELGPGTGVITKAILKRIPKETAFLAIEIDKDFVKLLRHQFPGVNIVHGSAADLPALLQEQGLEGCDSVISGLPWAAFGDSLQDELLGAVAQALRPGGTFVTFTYLYSPHLAAGKKFRQKLHHHFSRVEKTSIIWWNVPPAFAYYAEK